MKVKDKKEEIVKSKSIYFIICIVSLFVFLKILFDVIFKSNYLLNVDIWVSQNILSLHTKFLNFFMTVITYLGDTITVVVISCLIFMYLYKKRDKFDSYFYAFNMFVGIILVYMFKFFVHRARPLDQLILWYNYSFPSGHSAFSVIIAFSLYLIYKDVFKKNINRGYVVLLFLWPILIGFSRIYLNVHWFSDVIAGFALGVFVVSFGYLVVVSKKVDTTFK